MRKHLFVLLLTFLCLFNPYNLLAADIQSIGGPYIQNYSKSAYSSGNQNWSIAKGKNGMMYFANAEGLLTYDGKFWEQYKMPNRQIVRSVAAGKDGKIYTGSFGEFGYWDIQDHKFVYNSLVHLIPKKYGLKDEIWKIYIDNNRVIFQSFSSIYIYQNNRIEVVKGPSSFLFLHKVNSRYFVEAINKGLFELKGNELVYVNNSDKLGNTGILSILPFKGNQLLIGTGKNGLFIYDGADLKKMQTSANEYLETYQLNNGAKIQDKYFAYGTILNGIIIIDEDGRIVQRINKSSGLQNNTVLSLYADNEQNLWAGLDNGIDRIELNSPLYFYFDKTGQFGTVYSSIISDNKIYLGTNQGLFYSDWQPENSLFKSFNFKLIPNSQGQVWDLSKLDGQLIAGHNDGTFKVVNDRIEKISEVNGGWTIKKLISNPDFAVQGTYNGLALFAKDKKGNWNFDSKISGFEEPSRYVEQESTGDIWVSHAYKGLYKLKLSTDFKNVISKKYFDNKQGLPGNYNVNIFKLENKIVFSSDSGFYTFDGISNRFSKYEVLNKKLGSFASSNKIIDAGIKNYWFINHGKTALVTFPDPGKITVDSSSFNILDGRMVQYYENVNRISSSIYLISVDDGFVIYNASQNFKKTADQTLPKVLIRKIEDITDKYSVISASGNNGKKFKLDYNRNNIRIAYAMPYYRQAKIQFQYYLEGFSKEWSDWSYASQKDFTNLRQGSYIFKVRAKINDKTISGISAFEFVISPPWYASNWAILLYVILIIALLFIAKQIYERKLNKDYEKFADKLQQERDENLQKEVEANEKRIAKLETEKLHTELASKSRELANSAMTLVYKNELLQKLSGEITKLKDETGKKLAEDQVRKIQKVIHDGMNDVRDWNLFENSFNEAHESFFKKLKFEHPDLVPNDLKLCAYLRMNMSSKEMSSLLNISVRGVEIRRYRLRKKLNLQHDKNLVEFLMEL